MADRFFRGRAIIKEGEKRCRQCLANKPLDDFYKDHNKIDGKAYICKICGRKRQKYYNHKNREIVKTAKALIKIFQDNFPEQYKEAIEILGDVKPPR